MCQLLNCKVLIIYNYSLFGGYLKLVMGWDYYYYLVKSFLAMKNMNISQVFPPQCFW